MGDPGAKFAIEKFKRERMKLLESEKQKQKEREERERVQQKTNLEAELRGLNWLKKRAARAEKKEALLRKEEEALTKATNPQSPLNSMLAQMGFDRQVSS